MTQRLPDSQPPPETPFEQLLSEAAQWRVRLEDEAATDSDHRAFKRWLAISDSHRRAWREIGETWEALGGTQLPGARAALERSHAEERVDARRLLRRTVIGLAILAVLPAAGLWVSNTSLAYWLADYRSATGERRTVKLEDGSVLDMNTATAVDLHFDSARRRIALRRGEVHLRVAADPDRPLEITTEAGAVRALGTRFSVRRLDTPAAGSGLRGAAMRVAVYESHVRLCVASGESCRKLRRGEQARATADRIAPTEAMAKHSQPAWLQDRMDVLNQPVIDVLEELARYHPGILHYDKQALAGLRVSATLPLDDIPRALDALALALPIRIQAYGRWLLVVSRSEIEAAATVP